MNHIYSVYLIWKVARHETEINSLWGVYICEAIAMERQNELRKANPFHHYEIEEVKIDDHNNALYYEER